MRWSIAGESVVPFGRGRSVDRSPRRGRGRPRPRPRGKLVILTGAGLSADSGLPTFRGPEGYWTVGSAVYHPEEIATRAAWGAIPDEVWRFTVQLLRAAAGAAPNAGHRAIAELDRHFGEPLRHRSPRTSTAILPRRQPSRSRVRDPRRRRVCPLRRRLQPRVAAAAALGAGRRVRSGHRSCTALLAVRRHSAAARAVLRRVLHRAAVPLARARCRPPTRLRCCSWSALRAPPPCPT